MQRWGERVFVRMLPLFQFFPLTCLWVSSPEISRVISRDQWGSTRKIYFLKYIVYMAEALRFGGEAMKF